MENQVFSIVIFVLKQLIGEIYIWVQFKGNGCIFKGGNFFKIVSSPI